MNKKLLRSEMVLHDDTNVEQVEPTEAETNDTAATEAPVEAADEPAEPPKKTSRRTTKN